MIDNRCISKHSVMLPRFRSIGAVIEPYCVIHFSNDATKNRVKLGAFRVTFYRRFKAATAKSDWRNGQQL